MKLAASNLGRWSLSSFALAIAMSLAGTVQAQPNPNDAAKGANPPNWPQGGQGNRRGNFNNMTPAQQEQMLAQLQEQITRRRLTNAGVTDTATQDAIIAFMTDQDKARQALRDRFTKLNEGVQGNAATDAQLSASLNDLRQAVADEKTRRDAAAKDLDAKISYSKKPHLEAVLTVLGLIGDEASYAAGGLGGRLGGGGRGMGGMNNNLGGFGGGGGLFGGRNRGNRGNGNNGANNGPATPGGNNGNGGANLQAAAPANPTPANQ